jgi:hypothetical protein
MSQCNLKDEATRLVKEALLLLPGTLTAACSVALLQSPELVDTESDPSWFLQSEKDFRKAAFKLSMYWSKRFIYYGPRAYLPLNQSGNGALSPEDLAVLPTSCLQALPSDSRGRTVYWISGRRAMDFQTEADISLSLLSASACKRWTICSTRHCGTSFSRREYQPRSSKYTFMSYFRAPRHGNALSHSSLAHFVTQPK